MYVCVCVCGWVCKRRPMRLININADDNARHVQLGTEVECRQDDLFGKALDTIERKLILIW